MKFGSRPFFYTALYIIQDGGCCSTHTSVLPPPAGRRTTTTLQVLQWSFCLQRAARKHQFKVNIKHKTLLTSLKIIFMQVFIRASLKPFISSSQLSAVVKFFFRRSDHSGCAWPAMGQAVGRV